MHSHRLRHNRILQGRLTNICQQHTIFTGYKSRPRTHTDPSSTAKFVYLTRRNFGLVCAACPQPADDGLAEGTRRLKLWGQCKLGVGTNS